MEFGCKLWVNGCKLAGFSYKLAELGCKLRVYGCKLAVLSYKLAELGCKLWVYGIWVQMSGVEVQMRIILLTMSM